MCHTQAVAGDWGLQGEPKEKAGSSTEVYSGINTTIHVSICSQDSILFLLPIQLCAGGFCVLLV